MIDAKQYVRVERDQGIGINTEAHQRHNCLMLTSGRPHFSVNVTQTDRDLFSAASNMSAFDPPDRI